MEILHGPVGRLFLVMQFHHQVIGNGLELIKLVRDSTRAALPIIIMSGDAEAPDVIDAMHLSVVDFLLKPIDSVKLAKMVKRELGMAQ
jgi:DNA-binding NtrC family response regulator